jgi:hypothetical protein
MQLEMTFNELYTGGHQWLSTRMYKYKKNNDFTKLLSWNRKEASKARLWRVLLGKIRAQNLFLHIKWIVIRLIANIKVKCSSYFKCYKTALITEHTIR